MENLLLLNEILNTNIYVKLRTKYQIKYIDKFNLLNKLSPWIKGISKSAEMFSKNYFIYREFQTIGYCFIMFIDQIVSCNLNKILNQDEY